MLKHNVPERNLRLSISWTPLASILLLLLLLSFLSREKVIWSYCRKSHCRGEGEGSSWVGTLKIKRGVTTGLCRRSRFLLSRWRQLQSPRWRQQEEHILEHREARLVKTKTLRFPLGSHWKWAWASRCLLTGIHPNAVVGTNPRLQVFLEDQVDIFILLNPTQRWREAGGQTTTAGPLKGWWAHMASHERKNAGNASPDDKQGCRGGCRTPRALILYSPFWILRVLDPTPENNLLKHCLFSCRFLKASVSIGVQGFVLFFY